MEENIRGFLLQLPPSPLVRYLFELALLPHSHGPTPTDCVSVRGTDARIGVIKLAVRKCATVPLPVRNPGQWSKPRV